MQCLHDLHFMKKDPPHQTFQASQSWHPLSFYENKILVQNCLLNEWILKRLVISLLYFCPEAKLLCIELEMWMNWKINYVAETQVWYVKYTLLVTLLLISHDEQCMGTPSKIYSSKMGIHLSRFAFVHTELIHYI